MTAVPGKGLGGQKRQRRPLWFLDAQSPPQGHPQHPGEACLGPPGTEDSAFQENTHRRGTQLLGTPGPLWGVRCPRLGLSRVWRWREGE